MASQARIRECPPFPWTYLTLIADLLTDTASFSSTSERSIATGYASSSDESQETRNAKHMGFAHAVL
jgi:hypothetical protein